MNRQAGKEDEGLREKQNEVTAHLGLVHRTASRMYEYIPKEMPWEDVLQYGCMGLVEAVKRYEVGKGKLSTFAGIRIYGSIIDGVFQFLGIKRYRKEGGLNLQNLGRNELWRNESVFAAEDQCSGGYEEWTESILEKLSLEQALQRLKPEERELIDAFYFQQRTLAEYAREKCVNAEWVYLMHRRILKKLRKWLKS